MRIDRILSYRLRLVLTGSSAFLLFLYLLAHHPALPTWVMHPVMAGWPEKLILFFAFASSMALAREFLERHADLKVTDLLWQLLVISGTGWIITALMGLAASISDASIWRGLLHTAQLSVLLFVQILMISSTTFLFRRLIYYRKTPFKVVLWRAYLILAGLSCVLILFHADTEFLVWTKMLVIAGTIITALALLFRIQWIAFLERDERVTVLLMLLGIVVSMCAYLYYFPYAAFPHDAPGIVGILQSNYFFVLTGTFFPISYAAFSALMISFNLPTAVIYDERSAERSLLHDLNQIAAQGGSEEALYRLFLEACVQRVPRSAAWMRQNIPGSPVIGSFPPKSKVEMAEVEQAITSFGRPFEEFYHIRDTRNIRTRNLAAAGVASVVMLHLNSSRGRLGTLVLVSEITQVLEADTFATLRAYAEQLTLVLDNLSLLQESISVERYRAQIRVAESVQRQILPAEFPSLQGYQVYAQAITADEVGGDYYDLVCIPGNTARFVIADVSGKGISAAFFMAEMKGMFHALARGGQSLREMMIQANLVALACLGKSQFVTMTLGEVDLETHTVRLLRAGHCPAVRFKYQEQRDEEVVRGCTALGILLPEKFDQMVPEPACFSMLPGDSLLLYTDGMIEAKNSANEEFGEHRLTDAFVTYAHLQPRVMTQALIDAVRLFAHELDDDLSLLILKRTPETTMNLKTS